jgi:hypothetical protein
MIDPQLLAYLEENDYLEIREVPGRGICAVSKVMSFSFCLYYGLTRHDREGKYEYTNLFEAISALLQWDGQGHPPGEWLVHKGKKGRFYNPDMLDDSFYV